MIAASLALAVLAAGVTALIAVRAGRGGIAASRQPGQRNAEPEVGRHEAGAGGELSRKRDRHPVLLVDGRALNRGLIESYLADTRYEAVTAIDGEQALAAARRRRFHALLIDIRLPSHDGIDITRRLRTEGGPSRKAPVIAVAAGALAEPAERARRAGMDDVLVQPIDRTGLLDTLGRWCSDGGAGTPVDTPCRGHETTRPEAGPPPVIDEADGLRRAGGRADVARELLTMLARSLPDSRHELERAHAAGDLPSLHAAAHRLKGAAAYCGVPRLRSEVGELAARAREGDADGAAAALERLKETIDAVLAALPA